MRNLLSWLDQHILKFGVCLLLFFIPLWPKLPLVDITHTWVYIRLEDILVAVVVGIWVIQLFRRKVSLRSPLTLPIFLYWVVGGVSLFYCIIVLSPHLANFFPHVALLHYLRRIEYMILFFVVFSTIKNLKDVQLYLLVMILSLIGVIFYGLGQRFFGFPAFLTMNEEFAKGIPLRLPPNARVTSTFGGHYDLAAYMVIMIVLLYSLALGVKRRILQIFLLGLTFFSLLVLVFTASRVSFAVYLLAVSFMLVLQRRKILILPTLLISLLLLGTVKGATQRFAKTLRVEKVVYDTKTGQPIGTLQKKEDVGKIITEEEEVAKEELPLGSGFIALPIKKEVTKEATTVAVIKKPVKIPKEKKLEYSATTLKKLEKASEITEVTGSFLIQKALVYDISFTTRFQGEWPRAWRAFRKSPILGLGYSTISLATDNDYLRLLGETGILGLLSFLSIFLVLVFWTKEGLKKIKNPFFRSLVVGILSALFGMGLNAILIDVFEASKVAFTIWPLVGILLATVCFYQKKSPNWSLEVQRFLFSPLFTFLVLLGLGFWFFRPVFSCYFVGDDFTWLRGGAEGSFSQILSYFTLAGGYFYRPIGKLFFFLSYAFFWLKVNWYHFQSLFVHFLSALSLYLLANLLFRDKFFAFLSALFFFFHPVHSEAIVWTSGIMILFAGFFNLLSLLFWEKSQREDKLPFLFLSLAFFFLALLSHETAVVLPFLAIWLDFCFRRKKFWTKVNLLKYIPLFEVLLFYLFLRWQAGTHWLSGDYNINFARLPFNFAGNLFGYFGEFVLGKRFIPFYDQVRNYWRLHLWGSAFLLGTFGVLGWTIWRKSKKFFEQRIIFSLGFIFFALLSVLGLGNIAERYTYLALAGFSFLLSHLISKLLRKKVLAFLSVLLVLIFYYQNFQMFVEEWQKAGEITFNTLTVLRQNYPSFPKGSTLFFVNVPIRIGRAWVFPVGLEDALWFVYRDPTLGVRKEGRETALRLSRTIPNSFVFEFKNGELRELKVE